MPLRIMSFVIINGNRTFLIEDAFTLLGEMMRHYFVLYGEDDHVRDASSRIIAVHQGWFYGTFEARWAAVGGKARRLFRAISNILLR